MTQRSFLKLVVAAIAAVILALFKLNAPTGLEFSGKVTGVHDGDTITVLNAGLEEVRVRFYGVDAPESKQDYGSRAKEFTSLLCFGQTVTVKGHENDRYGRMVGEIILPDGRNLNQELVRAGFAWWYEAYAKNDTALEQLEAEARTQKRGLWAKANPTPPWEFRRHEREK